MVMITLFICFYLVIKFLVIILFRYKFGFIKYLFFSFFFLYFYGYYYD